MRNVHPTQIPKITDFEEEGTEIYVVQFKKNGGATKHATMKEYEEYLKKKSSLPNNNNG